MDRSGDIADAHTYYLSVGDVDVQRSFRCMDNPSNLDGLMQAVQTHTSRSFIVDFSDDTAWAAFDLSVQSLARLLDTPRPSCISTRWINLWYPFSHVPVLEELGKRYDFSPRLLALICSDPKQPAYSQSRTMLTKQVRKRSLWGRKLVTFEIQDPEMEKLANDELSEHSSITSKDSSVRGNLYKIASDIWHYSSVDFGRNYVCLGFNSLYGNKTSNSSHSDAGSSSSDHPLLPQCTRVWTWLLLCEDNTVISIHEDPFPYANGHFTSLQRRILTETRRNLVNVFRSLSTVTSVPLLAHNPLTLLPIRTRIGSTPEESAHRESDAPGLLFYYLFENWHNSYTLIARKESRYGVELSSLRESMFQQPTLEHIDRLDSIGKELGVLRRHYESYNRIIDRLIEPQPATLASLQNSQVVGSEDSASLNTIRAGPGGMIVREKDSLLGVSLSSAARVRFKRLRDLIDLYALSEVEEYLKQKDSLVSMASSSPTFQHNARASPELILIAIKQSLDVDRLTRITLLLTKATILFLPVSFMTGYFSVPLDDIKYSARTFWIAFVVIFFLSYLALFLFGAMNGSLQTMNVVEGMWKSIASTWTGVIAIHRRRKANGKLL
ncbi:hypothetical protein AC578_3595 [Pseudocercospora eumusae]|uniref:ADP-ribosylation factor n=1 Tax=Pseudocercospora eumusae TaxID=321146 RepID=A0A139HPM6_9PEZI|nr:hypothetical protein AC578_3595 [Pseudocercospora eumusae]